MNCLFSHFLSFNNLIRGAAFALTAVILAMLIGSVELSAQRKKIRAKSKPVGRGLITQKINPVILIHGIGGADLKVVERGFMQDGFPNDVLKSYLGDPYKLQFDSSGMPRTDNKSKDISAAGFLKVPNSRDITNLSEFLQTQGYQKNTDLFEFAYDFRFPVTQAAVWLGYQIDLIKKATGAEKVDVVGHSMGGLVVKQYLLDAANQSKIGTTIFVATPHLGAPKTLLALRYGDDLGVSLIDKCKLKRAVHNLPSMFNLLPGRKYFQQHGGYFVDAGDVDQNQITGLLDFEQTNSFLNNARETRCLLKANLDAAPHDKLSDFLLTEHSVKFHDALDEWVKPATVKVYSIVGYGRPTIKAIEENGANLSAATTTEGDGTVPLWSTEAAPTDETFYANLLSLKTDHTTIIGNPQIDNQILALLRGKTDPVVAAISAQRPAGRFTTGNLKIK